MIALAEQRNDSSIHVYDENGMTLFIESSGELLGFTSNTVSIKRNGVTFVYDEKGRIKFYR